MDEQNQQKDLETLKDALQADLVPAVGDEIEVGGEKAVVTGSNPVPEVSTAPRQVVPPMNRAQRRAHAKRVKSMLKKLAKGKDAFDEREKKRQAKKQAEEAAKKQGETNDQATV